MPYSYAFTADFTTPDPVANLVLTPDPETISVLAEWDASLDPFHYEYLIEVQGHDADGEWAEVGRTTETSFAYYFAPSNIDMSLRVSDSNGSQYSDPTEETAHLEYEHWSLVSSDGSVLLSLPNDLPGTRIDLPLDQRSVQPLSGPDGDDQFPLVFTGQWQGERISASFYIFAVDRQAFLDAFRAAARLPQGTVALKDPDGGVFVVAVGGLSLQDMGNGDRQLNVTAVRIQ